MELIVLGNFRCLKRMGNIQPTSDSHSFSRFIVHLSLFCIFYSGMPVKSALTFKDYLNYNVGGYKKRHIL